MSCIICNLPKRTLFFDVFEKSEKIYWAGYKSNAVYYKSVKKFTPENLLTEIQLYKRNNWSMLFLFVETIGNTILGDTISFYRYNELNKRHWQILPPSWLQIAWDNQTKPQLPPSK